MSALRYVVLHHTGIASPHFDLMFQRPQRETLGCVRCEDWPPNAETKFERIHDHRPFYLDYEGPVSENRGAVARVESGTCTIEADGEDLLLLKLSSGRQIRLPRTGSD